MNNKGFTLIELLVVVLIIGILSAIALPQYTKAVEKSRASEAQAWLADFVTGQALYKTANGKYALAAKVGDMDVTLPTPKHFTVSNTSTADKAMAKLTRNDSNAYYALVVEMTNDADTGRDKIVRYCTGKSAMCQVINNGADACSATPVEADAIWCYGGD